MTKIKGIGELYMELDGKTERPEIESILNRTTVAVLKAYMSEEGFDCTGYHTWKKADFVETIAVALMEDAIEGIRAELPHEMDEEETVRQITEEIRTAETVEAIAEALKKCNKVKGYARNIQDINR